MNVTLDSTPNVKQARRSPCARCSRLTAVESLVLGFGPDCAQRLGLTVPKPRIRAGGQDGPDLFDTADEDDHCDGWDAP